MFRFLWRRSRNVNAATAMNEVREARKSLSQAAHEMSHQADTMDDATHKLQDALMPYAAARDPLVALMEVLINRRAMDDK